MTCNRLFAATLLVLILVTSASADCAWVVWKQTQAGPSLENWSLYEAYESKRECDSEKVNWTRIAAARSAGPGLSRVLKDGGLIVTQTAEGKEIRREEFHCLPSATDPRPRYKE